MSYDLEEERAISKAKGRNRLRSGDGFELLSIVLNEEPELKNRVMRFIEKALAGSNLDVKLIQKTAVVEGKKQAGRK